MVAERDRTLMGLHDLGLKLCRIGDARNSNRVSGNPSAATARSLTHLCVNTPSEQF